MANAANITAWITFFIGLYAISAGFGEFRRPGFWRKMVSEVQSSNALQFLIGMVTIVIGAVIYLTNPYDPKDILSILITVMGAFIFLEGAAILAFGDWFLGLSAKLMNQRNRIWAGLSVVVGVIAIVVAVIRLQV